MRRPASPLAAVRRMLVSVAEGALGFLDDYLTSRVGGQFVLALRIDGALDRSARPTLADVARILDDLV